MYIVEVDYESERPPVGPGELTEIISQALESKGYSPVRLRTSWNNTEKEN